MKTPSITPAQYAAAATWIVAQLVAFGVLTSANQQQDVSIGATLLAIGWKVSDAVIRHGRSKVGLELAAQVYQRELRAVAAAQQGANVAAKPAA